MITAAEMLNGLFQCREDYLTRYTGPGRSCTLEMHRVHVIGQCFDRGKVLPTIWTVAGMVDVLMERNELANLFFIQRRLATIRGDTSRPLILFGIRQGVVGVPGDVFRRRLGLEAIRQQAGSHGAVM